MGKKKLSDRYPIVEMRDDTTEKLDILGQVLQEGDLVLYAQGTRDGNLYQGSIIKKTVEILDHTRQGIIQTSYLTLRMRSGQTKDIYAGYYGGKWGNCVKINALVQNELKTEKSV